MSYRSIVHVFKTTFQTAGRVPEDHTAASDMKRGVVKMLSDQYRSSAQAEKDAKDVSVAETFYGHAPAFVIQEKGRGTSYYGGDD